MIVAQSTSVRVMREGQVLHGLMGHPFKDFGFYPKTMAFLLVIRTSMIRFIIVL